MHNWTLLVKCIVYTKTGRIDIVSARETNNDVDAGRPRLAMSALNAIRRSIAEENGVPLARVSVDWFEFVVGDEAFAN